MSALLFRALGGPLNTVSVPSHLGMPMKREHDTRPSQLLSSTSIFQPRPVLSPPRHFSTYQSAQRSFPTSRFTHCWLDVSVAVLTATLLAFSISTEVQETEDQEIVELKSRINANIKNIIVVISRSWQTGYWGVGRALTEADIGKKVIRTGPITRVMDWSYTSEFYYLEAIDNDNLYLNNGTNTCTLSRAWNDKNWMSSKEYDYFYKSIQPTLQPVQVLRIPPEDEYDRF